VGPGRTLFVTTHDAAIARRTRRVAARRAGAIEGRRAAA
jgi:predicted ABC-type transport system involved in lysophospholipase L1 biosynthesis ATPase subunit